MEYHRLQLPACTFDACHDMFFMAAFMHVAEFVMRIFEFQGCTVAFVKLIRLYVQKGHDPAACRRFLKRVHPPRFTCADSGILCVCPALSQRVTSLNCFSQFKQGNRAVRRFDAYKAMYTRHQDTPQSEFRENSLMPETPADLNELIARIHAEALMVSAVGVFEFGAVVSKQQQPSPGTNSWASTSGGQSAAFSPVWTFQF